MKAFASITEEEEPWTWLVTCKFADWAVSVVLFVFVVFVYSALFSVDFFHYDFYYVFMIVTHCLLSPFLAMAGTTWISFSCLIVVTFKDCLCLL